MSGSVPSSIGDNEIFARWQDDFTKMLDGRMPRANEEVGIWFGRNGESVVIMMVRAQNRATVRSQSFAIPESNKVVISGKLLFDAESVYGLINRGNYGASECEVDISIRLPDFRVFCTSDPADATARIAVGATEPHRVLGRSAVAFIARRSLNDEPTYRHLQYVTESQGTGKTINARILSLLNKVRADAHLPAVRLASKQSEISTRVAPHYFASADKAQSADSIALGLLAGWDVDGLIRRARFMSNAVYGASSAAHWLNSALASPSWRAALLDKHADQVAIGALVDSMEIPSEILSAAPLHLAIGVTHHRPKGAAWAQYAVIIVYLRPSSMDHTL